MNMENSIIEEWKNTLKELKKEIKSNKKKHDLYEPLSKWLDTQQNNYISKRGIMKNPLIYDSWCQFTNECKQNMTNENYENYFYNQIHCWDKQFIELTQFIHTNHRFPANHHFPEERSLLYFFEYNQWQYLDNTLSVKIYDKWDTFLETYKYQLLTTQYLYKSWEELFIILTTFIGTNDRFPHESNGGEQFLYNWFITQNRSYKIKKYSMSVNVRYNKWTQFIEDYKKYFIETYGKPYNEIPDFMTDEELWLCTFNDLKKFIDTNRRSPIFNTNDKMEKELYEWVNLQSKRYIKGDSQSNNTDNCSESCKHRKMSGIESAIWSFFIKEYDVYITKPIDTWDLSFNTLKQFIDIHNKLPWYREPNNSYIGNITYSRYKGRCTDEQCLYMFLSENYNYFFEPKKCKNYDVWTQFLAKYKEYFTVVSNLPDMCNSNISLHILSDISELKYYIRHNKNNIHKNEKTEKETLIYEWWVDSLLKNPEFNNTYLDDYKEYFDYPLWNEQFSEIKRFINTYEKLPWYKNPDEIYYYDILYKLNRIALCNNELQWKEFLLEYKQYFIFTYYFYTPPTFMPAIHKYLKWMADFSELQYFINKNKRLPMSYSNDNPEISSFYNEYYRKQKPLYYIDNTIFHTRFNGFIKTLL